MKRPHDPQLSSHVCELKAPRACCGVICSRWVMPWSQAAPPAVLTQPAVLLHKEEIVSCLFSFVK